MGRAAAWELARQGEVSELILEDGDTGTLAAAKAFLEALSDRGIKVEQFEVKE